MSRLTHIDAEGRARMVDVADKAETVREARASGRLVMAPATLELALSGGGAKGDVRAVAEIAGVMAAKRTAELIPMCHPLSLTSVKVVVTPSPDGSGLTAEAVVRCKGRTGVEMEALTAASTALLTLYDMLKAVDRGMTLEGIGVSSKSGGASGGLDAGMTLPGVDAARASMLATVSPLPAEPTPLAEADGRWLAEAVTATRDQPPFDCSAMDGWAVRAADVRPGARLRIVGESAAGGATPPAIAAGEALRIFTGAPLPRGADAIVMQERARRDGEVVALDLDAVDPGHVRPRGGDFRSGQALIKAGVRLNPWRLALAASAGRDRVACSRRPHVVVAPTGDELAPAGSVAQNHQIHDAAGPAVAALARRWGAQVETAPIVRDDDAAVREVLSTACDLLVVIGGASVGDHDRLRPVVRALGGQMIVEGCAVRPGKPVWLAILPDGRTVLGLPGNPASALVCAELFLAPLLAALQGGSWEARIVRARALEALPTNGPREHYMRARLELNGGEPTVRVFAHQDSSLVSVLAAADVLVRRPAGAAAVAAGEAVEVLLPGA